MSQKLLEGVRVVDLAGEPAAIAGRILADLGADVVKVEPPTGDPLRREALRFAAWNAGKRSLACEPDDPRLRTLLREADLVLETPGWPGVPRVDPRSAPGAAWVRVTPFGLSGPRAHWQASDLGVMASSGNMFATGFPDRAPVRCSEPSGYAHGGAEAAFAALCALASGVPQQVDVSLQEAVLVANMSAPAWFPQTGERGRRLGASVGRTREIWPCRDGFVSFGLRGGAARIPSLRLMTKLLGEAGVATPAWTERDWTTFNPNETSDAEMRLLEEPLAEFFATRSMVELYELACETNLMLASANSPREIYQSAQLEARAIFGRCGELDGFPLRFAIARSADGLVEDCGARAGAPPLTASRSAELSWSARAGVFAAPAASPGAWHGTRILEFGAGAAGPIATRFFAEQGATVVKVESRSRPDFLRVYALGPGNPHALEGSPLFDCLNTGKMSLTLDLKSAEGVATARRLFQWSDAVLENFAPRAMKSFGLDYDTMVREKPDLVMVSSCLNGQTGPHRDYPGFGGQGSALSGFNFLTGWPDREPVGPYGTITDSLSPRFAATAAAAGLLYRRRTGKGVHLDLSQVEVALYALSPWLLAYANGAVVTRRMGNRSPRAVPHGAFPCQGEDRWVAIAVWDDDGFRRLAALTGMSSAGRETLVQRLEQVDSIESELASWTRTRRREEVAELLQREGIEAVPVADFGDLHQDPQLALREHFVELDHPVLGPHLYERNGFRLEETRCGYARASPTLGQHNEAVLRDLLGESPEAIAALESSGALD